MKMDPVFDEDIENDFKEQEIPIPEWMQVDGNERDPLDLSTVKTEQNEGSAELQSSQLQPTEEDVLSSTILHNIQIKIEEEIHIEDYSEYFDQNTSTTLGDADQIKSETDFYSEDSDASVEDKRLSCNYTHDVKQEPGTVTQDFETKPQPVVLDLVAVIKTEQSLNHAHDVKQEPGTMRQDVTEEHGMDLGEQNNKSKYSPAPSLPLSGQLEGIASCGVAEVSSEYKMCNYMPHCNRDDKGHMTHKDDNLFYCAHCDYKTKNKLFLTSHMDKHINKSIVDRILNKYHYKSAYYGHSKRRLSPAAAKRIFSCNLCQYKSAYSGSLKSHMLTHTGEKNFICNICQHKFAHCSHLKRHMLTHTGEKKFICNICLSRFALSSTLKSHMLTHTGEKKFICNICHFKLSRASNLKRHMLTHTGDKNRLLSHTGERKFVCNICLSKFTQSGTLKRHMLIHTGEKRFICNICQSKFTQSGSLKFHMLTHTREKRFICNICQSKYTRSDSLKSHMLIHTGERRFICNICQLKFTRSGGLRTHIKAHYKE